MSFSTFAQTISRISCASPTSPIAVFKTPSTFKVEVLFADILSVRKRIEGGEGLVGVYHRKSDKRKTRSDILAALSSGEKYV